MSTCGSVERHAQKYTKEEEYEEEEHTEEGETEEEQNWYKCLMVS